MKKAVTSLLHLTGAFVPFRMANRDKALILTYHRFSHSRNPETTSARSFVEQLDYLRNNYQIVPLSSLAEYVSSGERLPSGLASITIDDGYDDFYEIAFPILKGYKIPATIFVVTRFLDRTDWLWTDKVRFIASRSSTDKFRSALLKLMPEINLDRHGSRSILASQLNAALKKIPDDVKHKLILRISTALGVQLPDVPPVEYAPISWEQAREMDATGVQIASHSATHPILTNVSDEQLRAELCESKTRIEMMIDRNADLFCYPNGSYDQRISLGVRNAGYRGAVTIVDGLNECGADAFRLKRVHTQNSLARFIQCTSGFDQFKNRMVHAGMEAAAV